MIYVGYRTLLVMFCVLKYYFVDFNGMFTSFQGCQIRQSENTCALQSWENIIFQNKTFLVMLYRQNKTFWYQFCNFKHFLKAENCEDSLASSWHSKPMVSSVTLLELSDCWHYLLMYWAEGEASLWTKRCAAGRCPIWAGGTHACVPPASDTTVKVGENWRRT